MEYATASTDDIDSVMPEEHGSMWFFREPLECENVGVTLLELEPDSKGKAHDHADDGQEEVYLVVDGELTVQVSGGEEAPPEAELSLAAGEAVRIGPETHRQLHNHGDGRARVVVAGAP
ncbi:cupin [Halobacteriales archaeon QS_9_68_42]|nr:MAG: cupin [Halobacteriales archaeon QS_1_68_44]PSQ43490.1 MAG: cupin [Halobacteriales archaeon QS_9_68_42]